MSTQTQNQDNRIHYLYRIINKINGKIYIGQTVDPTKRWYEHRRSSANPVMAIGFAIKKYGAENFEYEILACCKTWNNANELETLLVSQYSSFVPNGYNVTLGGMNAPKTQEWKDHMSKIMHTIKQGTIRSEEACKKASETMKKKCTDGWVPVTSFKSGSEATKYWKGKEGPRKGMKTSEETKKKISEAGKGRIPHNKGIAMPENQKKLLSEINKGKRSSPETEFKEKILSSEQISNIIKLIEAGNSVTKTSKALGISRYLVSKALS